MQHNLGQKIKRLFNRRMIIVLLILSQILLTGILLWRMVWLKVLLSTFSIVTALHLLMRPDKSAFKLSMVFLILLFPVFGGAFYWIFHSQTSQIGFRTRLSRVERESKDAFRPAHPTLNEAIKALPVAKKQLLYLNNNTPFPVYRSTATRYFASGKEMLPQLLEDLSRAEKYIFLEYFIIEEGSMWNAILNILRDRVGAGVDVRIIYDDLGCFFTLPPSYDKRLRAMGIRCEKFNRFHPFLTSTQNNRDHRKIAVVDGRIAYTGGINLADEYIGERIKYGAWKDCAIRLAGDGAWSFTVMFLQNWSFLSRTKENYESYRPSTEDKIPPANETGWVQPYATGPMDRDNVAEQVYLRIIEQAQEYLYITTPYLMVDDSMISALKASAKCGVDVRIITPEIPDKKTVHFTTRSYYASLLRAGVRIYEYKDGFMHAKLFAADDAVATVGTVNLDFRSLYLHFECGTCLYQTESIHAIKQDFLTTLEGCREILPKDCKANLFVRFFQSICRIFAPLM